MRADWTRGRPGKTAGHLRSLAQRRERVPQGQRLPGHLGREGCDCSKVMLRAQARSHGGRGRFASVKSCHLWQAASPCSCSAAAASAAAGAASSPYTRPERVFTMAPPAGRHTGDPADACISLERSCAPLGHRGWQSGELGCCFRALGVWGGSGPPSVAVGRRRMHVVTRSCYT